MTPSEGGEVAIKVAISFATARHNGGQRCAVQTAAAAEVGDVSSRRAARVHACHVF